MSEQTKWALTIGWPVFGVVSTVIYRWYCGYRISLADILCGAVVGYVGALFVFLGALNMVTIWGGRE